MAQETRRVIKKERKGHYRVKEGTWESALMFIKDAFPEETMGVSDTSFWQEIEEKAILSRKEAAFQYCMIEVSHIDLAEMLVNNFLTVRTASNLGQMSEEDKQNRITRLAHVIYKNYPPKYQAKYKA